MIPSRTLLASICFFACLAAYAAEPSAVKANPYAASALRTYSFATPFLVISSVSSMSRSPWARLMLPCLVTMGK